MREHSYELGLRGKSFRNMAHAVSSNLSDNYDLARVVFHDAPNLGVGGGRACTDVLPDGNLTFLCLIGTKGLPRSIGRVDDDDALDTLVSIYHEFEHVRQTMEYERESTNEGIVLCVNRAAARGNRLHYNQNHNLYCTEVQAERNALMSLQRDMPTLFPKKSAAELDACLLRYVNRKAQFDVGHFFYCGRADVFDSMDMVYDTFEGMYRYCDDDFPLYDESELANGDDFSQVMYLGQDSPEKWSYFQDTVLRTTDGFRRKAQMACVALYLHPNISTFVPGVNRLDLSPENVFGRAFPESPDEITARLKPLYSFSPHLVGEARRTYSARDCADMPLIGESYFVSGPSVVSGSGSARSVRDCSDMPLIYDSADGAGMAMTF